MFRWAGVVAVGLCVCIPAIAQTPARAVNPVFIKAQELVSDGNGAAGRALVDSVLKANSPTSQIYPEALYWRASLAASAADAESDYKHIVVDFPLAPQAEDALLRLAQLELARGDKDAALAHLQKISTDYPRSKSLARASYWTARVFLEKNDLASACAANARAASQAGADEVELRNQITYQSQRCGSYDAAKASPPVAAVPAASASAAAPVGSPGVGSTTSSTPATVSSTASSTVATASSTVSSTRSPVNTQQETARVKAPVQANDTKPSIVDAARLPQPRVDAAKTTQAVARSAEYSVQVAAYNTRPDAEKLASTLKSRGYDARVDGTVAPFRVRIGRYASSREADAELARIKTRHMEGFVVRAPER